MARKKSSKEDFNHRKSQPALLTRQKPPNAITITESESFVKATTAIDIAATAK